ncbi:heme biosynthesis HemY N-terminal domain-containing protein [Litoribrevibacter euphylliae]|uniref:Heme biosynthesis HemY N-terminal domain-containing protein n=1 Tax=Litoribrevibacter euphylliae TaxID=1834034 RepID=A0ABV7HM07_9GAMM
MRGIVLFAVAFLLIGGGFVYLASDDKGYVLLSYSGYTFETSFWFALLMALVGLSIFYCVIRVFNILVLAPKTIRFWNKERIRKRALFTAMEGLVEYTQANWSKSEKLLKGSLKDSKHRIIHYLAMARAAQEQGKTEECDSLLATALNECPKHELAIYLAQAEIQLDRGMYEQALATLVRARELAPNHRYLLKLQSTAYLKLKDWVHLKNLLPELKKRKALTDSEINTLERRITKSFLTDKMQAVSKSSDKEEAYQELQRFWRSLPVSMQTDSRTVIHYVNFLRQVDQEAQAERVIRHFLRDEWVDKLVYLYGQIKGDDVARQLLEAERWLQERPHSAVLMLTLGRLCLANQLWGKAREYFEISLRLDQNAEIYGEMCRLLGHLGEYEKSNQYFRQAVSMMTDGLPDLPMPKPRSGVGEFEFNPDLEE